MRRNIIFLFAMVSAIYAVSYQLQDDGNYAPPSTEPVSVSQAEPKVIGAGGGLNGQCPLKHTEIKAEISGFISRVTVTQKFENPFTEKIEAVYIFPLPHNAAIDDMTMRVGARTIKGKIMSRDEARSIYEIARDNGQVTALLDQERPNIFTQSVANILPGEDIEVTISYVEMLKYEDGSYQFALPMVVAPRYIPGEQNMGVPDYSRITPPTLEGMRSGYDISIEIAIDAGVPINGLRSVNHEIHQEWINAHSARVRLKNCDEIANRDFVLNYTVAGERIEDAVLAHRAGDEGFFALILQPPNRIPVKEVTPKEIVFVLDTSGSMSGFPIEKTKEAMRLALDGLYPQDTFNLITFAGHTEILFPYPVRATKENLERAESFMEDRAGDGGTEMMKAIRAALSPSDSLDHVRIVCFMTDGAVGNDFEIISEVQKHRNARVFSFGIGNSVNRFLLDRIAEEGRGEVEYVSLNDDGSAAARRFHERIRAPLLTDITIDWRGLPVKDIFPARIPDLFGAKPVVVCGRYTKSGRGVIRLRGKMAGREVVRNIPVELPPVAPYHESLIQLWAREQVDHLMRQDYSGLKYGNIRQDIREGITQLGIKYRLMTQFTSFVAVEETMVTDGDKPRRVEVPVSLPEGIRAGNDSGEWDGVATEDYSLWGMTQKMEWPSIIVCLALFIMSVYGMAVTCRFCLTLITARRHSRRFLPMFKALMRERRMEEAMKLCEQYSKSPAAAVINAGLGRIYDADGSRADGIESPEFLLQFFNENKDQ